MTMGDIPTGFIALMPTPLAFYRKRLPRMTEPDEHGWASSVCPLARYPIGHRMRVNVDTGMFRCEVCGGGDLILFQMLLSGERFKPVVLALIEEGKVSGLAG